MSAKAWSSLRHHLGKSQANLCLLAGSGIHAQWNAATHREKVQKEILSSWPSLLSALGAEPRSAQTLSSVRWEQLTIAGAPARAVIEKVGISLSKWRRLAARERETVLQQATAKCIAEAEAVLAASAKCGLDPVKRVVNSRVVTDVISLNLDTVAERMLGEWKSPAQRVRSDKPQVIAKANGERVRVWHPHGDHRRPTSIRLGLRHYASLTPQVDKARRIAKSLERGQGYDAAKKHALESPESWVELMLHRPLLVLGASLSELEWDLWQSFVDRRRNYAKHGNGGYQPPMWILSTPCSHPKLPHDWFEQLQDTEWTNAWNRLADMMPQASD
jgi:hypothetical protein